MYTLDYNKVYNLKNEQTLALKSFFIITSFDAPCIRGEENMEIKWRSFKKRLRGSTGMNSLVNL